MLMRDVAVSEHDLIDRVLATQALQFRFVDDRDPVGIKRSGQHDRIATSADAGNLRRRECHHPDVLIVAVNHVEIVEVASGSTEDDDLARTRRIQ
jgi:hypothetical protein